MPQSSAPVVGANLSDQDWRDLFGEEAGVIGDTDGTAYKLTTATDSDVIQVGSTTQRSMARVAAFAHRIPLGETEAVTIPAASGSSRTDIIALRYDPSYSGAPGPVRLVVISGSASGPPTLDDKAPGVEELPLWAVTRTPGQALAQAVKRQLFSRLAPVLELAAEADLPASSPLGTIARRGATVYRRTLNSSGTPVWSQDQYVQSTAPADAPEGAIWFQVT